MKIKIIILILLMVSLVFSGCVEETGPSNNNADDNNDGEVSNNDNSGNDGTDAIGWYLTEIRDYGDKVTSTNDYYIYDVIYNRENITTITYGGDGQEVRIRTTYETPPEFIEAESDISINVKKEGLIVKHGGLGLDDTSSIKIDFPELELGYSSSSKYYLSNPTYGKFFKLGYGDGPETIKEAVFVGTAPTANAFNGNFSITFQFQNGGIYGTEYVYEWRK